MKQIVEKKLKAWNSSDVSVCERWVQAFEEMAAENELCTKSSRVVELALSFPGMPRL